MFSLDNDDEEYTDHENSQHEATGKFSDEQKQVFVQVHQQEEADDSSDIKSPLTGGFASVKLNTESEKNISNDLSAKLSNQNATSRAKIDKTSEEDVDEDYEDDDYEDDNQYEEDDGFDEDSSSQLEVSKKALAKPSMGQKNDSSSEQFQTSTQKALIGKSTGMIINEESRGSGGVEKTEK